MKNLFLAACLFLGLASTAQTTVNDPNAKTRTLSASFNKISISSGIEVYLTQGNENSLAVSMNDEKYNERFKTEVENGTLKIYYEHKNDEWKNSKGRKLKAYVSYKTLESIRCAAGSNTRMTNTLNTGNLTMSFSSGCMFTGEIKAADVTVDASSGANAVVKGSANKLSIEASSGADFKGNGLSTNTCTASVNSGASIKIDVKQTLNASANSGGAVVYTGAATVTKGNINSGGSVRKAS
jgi:hypothetical protein